jgi:hypothetical protein
MFYIEVAISVEFSIKNSELIRDELQTLSTVGQNLKGLQVHTIYQYTKIQCTTGPFECIRQWGSF